ncbi:hypothetical protein AXF42_Ash010759 [Apostasia shenzhenica]|uniref:Uncharacterized protein n=1 Tax=Apostasia shenzhenica TaxID=1088818 RepID=A0A2I0A0K0_9ASPA|nr:hypothetical protein AXF42_Ash010759 [Apostasia shenzhenica]
MSAFVVLAGKKAVPGQFPRLGSTLHTISEASASINCWGKKGCLFPPTFASDLSTDSFMGINKNYSSSNFLMKLFLLIFLMISHSLLLCALAQGIKTANNEEKIRAGEKEDRDEGKQRPNPAERGIGITGFNSHWEAFRTWIKLTSMNFCPRNFWLAAEDIPGLESKPLDMRFFPLAFQSLSVPPIVSLLPKVKGEDPNLSAALHSSAIISKLKKQ